MCVCVVFERVQMCVSVSAYLCVFFGVSGCPVDGVLQSA